MFEKSDERCKLPSEFELVCLYRSQFTEAFQSSLKGVTNHNDVLESNALQGWTNTFSLGGWQLPALLFPGQMLDSLVPLQD